jgi:MFS family permease
VRGSAEHARAYCRAGYARDLARIQRGSCNLAIQGLGGGGITASTTILVADLVPLRDRGLFEGLLSMCACLLFPLCSADVRLRSAWGVFTCVGPLIAGVLTQAGQWRWVFCELLCGHKVARC